MLQGARGGGGRERGSVQKGKGCPNGRLHYMNRLGGMGGMLQQKK